MNVLVTGGAGFMGSNFVRYPLAPRDGVRRLLTRVQAHASLFAPVGRG